MIIIGGTYASLMEKFSLSSLPLMVTSIQEKIQLSKNSVDTYRC